MQLEYVSLTIKILLSFTMNTYWLDFFDLSVCVMMCYIASEDHWFQ